MDDDFVVNNLCSLHHIKNKKVYGNYLTETLCSNVKL